MTEFSSQMLAPGTQCRRPFSGDQLPARLIRPRSMVWNRLQGVSSKSPICDTGNSNSCVQMQIRKIAGSSPKLMGRVVISIQFQ